MSIYSIGDVQGCYKSLTALIKKLDFKSHDQLWFAGDLVNRGPNNSDVLRLIIDLGEQARVVLGNHDLHLLAIAHGVRRVNRKDTVTDVLDAHDCHTMLNWLYQQPLVVCENQWFMSHAGLPPTWSVSQAQAYSQEVQQALANPKSRATFFANMYGDQPAVWDEKLKGTERLRLITNYLTRMRFCTADGQLDMQIKEGLGSAPEGFVPWFELIGQTQLEDHELLFGHWAALLGQTDHPTIHAVDTGCVWGGKLTALRLEDKQRFAVSCQDTIKAL